MVSYQGERRTTGIILVNELHYLALEERLRLLPIDDPLILDNLPIIRLVGHASKGGVPRLINDSDPWVTIKEWETESLEYDYYFLNPEHDAFSLQNASKLFRERGYRTLPINYLEIQIDLYQDDRDIFRIGFQGKRLSTDSETWKTAYSRIMNYRENYGLYSPIDAGNDEQIRMWLGRIRCLEMIKIFRGSIKAKDSDWKKPRDVTRDYLEMDFLDTGDFFPLIFSKTGGLVEEVYQIYDDTERGWTYNGLVRER